MDATTWEAIGWAALGFGLWVAIFIAGIAYGRASALNEKHIKRRLIRGKPVQIIRRR